MFSIVRKIVLILNPAERWRAALVTLMMVFQAVAEVSGIVSITPFLAVLGNPNVVRTNRHLAWIYNGLGFTSPQNFLIALGILAFFVLAGASLFRAIVQYVRSRYTNMRRHSISILLLEKYIRQPYSFFLQNNSSQLTTAILSEVDQFILNGLVALMQLISYSFVTLAIITLLLVVSLKLALFVACTLGIFYGLIFWRLSKATTHFGHERKHTNLARYQVTGEIFGGVKELKVLGREKAYINAFRRLSLSYSRAQTYFQVISETPRYLIEIIGFCALFMIVLVLMHDQSDLGHALPVIGLYAFAAYRLLPAAQNIYNALTTLRFGTGAIDTVYRDLYEGVPPAPLVKTDAKMRVVQGIELRNLDFRYPGSQKDALNSINMTMPAMASTGIIGATGAGKSTLVDLILGILEPTGGAILIDGVALDAANMRTWQNTIGYVPQQIFLADDTVARNIAFGIPEESIDRIAVETAARMAQIDGFITSELTDGYDTIIGERGIRLSGGQRQRIGIARALYHNPDVLVLDEATSALDTETEAALMQSIERLAGAKTIIMIAHRHDTLRFCERIITVEQGSATIAKRADLPDTAPGEKAQTTKPEGIST